MTSTTLSKPAVSHTYTVKPEILALVINTGEVLYAQQVPYHPLIGDQVQGDQPKEDQWVKRGGQTIGALVGNARNLLYTFDRLTGPQLNTSWADQVNSYRISSIDDPTYRNGLTPKAVFRKTKPTDMARTAEWQFDWPLAHVLYLELPSALKVGNTYQIAFSGAEIAPVSFVYQPEQLQSEAVHVSQVGFRSDDPAKVAFLSCWMGNGGKVIYPESLAFWLIDEQSGQKVYASQIKLTKASDQPEDPLQRNYNLTDVYQLDFSNFNQSGRYRVCVEGVGCSFAFAIEDNPWQAAFVTSARGFYHQRSGISLGPPYTSVVRPRPFHPDDGVIIYQSTTPLVKTGNGLNAEGTDPDNFTNLVKGKTDQPVLNVWGGYFDAGDWDRRIQHLEVSRLLLELVELFPPYFASVPLNIPESSNTLPDIVDEALWGIDFYRRLQTSEGGIRGGIESASHPRYGEASWQESLVVMAYAPDLWSSYIYAGVAARAAYWLESRLPEQARVYQESALKAMDYAEQAYATSLAQGKTWPHPVRDERNLAALELFRLTGSDRWHQLFLETTVFTDPKQDMYQWESHQQRDAAFVYARLQHPAVNVAVQQNALSALLREADQQAQFSANTGFKWTKMHPYEPIGWGTSFGSPKAITLLRAHFLTGKETYLQAGLLVCQFSAGANPNNMTFTTGVGDRNPQHPLVIDQRVMGEPAPPGITVYGPLDMQKYPNYWAFDLFKSVTFPAPDAWPTTEAYFDVYLLPPVTEFTVMQTMAPTAYAWGYLAARPSL